MNKPVIIPFSGACLSGKTTTMHLLKDYLEERDYTVRIIKEPIRDILDYLGLTIDDLRNDFSTFIKVQKEVILNRKTFEIDMTSNYEEDFVFIDRSASDSFFYITYYPNKQNLTDEQMKLYEELLTMTIEYVKESKYSLLLDFKPLQNILEKDVNEYRPQNISKTKQIEYEMISFYNKTFFNSLCLTVDLNISSTIEELKDILMDLKQFSSTIEETKNN